MVHAFAHVSQNVFSSYLWFCCSGKPLKLFQKYVIKIKTVFTRFNLQHRIFWSWACYHYCGDKYNTIASPYAPYVKSIFPFCPTWSIFLFFVILVKCAFNRLTFFRQIVYKYYIFKKIPCKTSTHPCDTGLSLFSKWQKLPICF